MILTERCYFDIINDMNGTIREKMFYIYLTTNLINGKKYIGQHKGSPNDSYLGSGTTILKAIAKYGKENFKKEILCFCDSREEADQKEKEFISLYDAVNSRDFYNNAEGGTGGDGWKAAQRWMEANPEKAKKLHEANSKRLIEWVKNNPEMAKRNTEIGIEAMKQWRVSHPEQVAAQMIKVNEAKKEWQIEHPEEHKKQVDEWRKAGSDANSQKIICVTTGVIYNSQCEASRQTGVPQSNISKCLKGERKFAGRDKESNEKLVWRKYEE